jgi:hypothetical protein
VAPTAKFLVATATANAPVSASKATIDHVTDFLLAVQPPRL